MRLSRFIHKYAFVCWVLFLILVTIGSLLPQADSSAMHKGGDKVIHFLAYFALALYPAAGLKTLPKALSMALGMIVCGFLLELGQMALPSRLFSWGDMAANAAGVFLGLGLGLLMRNRWLSWGVEE